MQASIAVVVACLTFVGVPAAIAESRSPFYTFETLVVPNSGSETIAYGINAAGRIVGSFAGQGFLTDGNSFTAIDVPDAHFTQVLAINARGVMVGYCDCSSAIRGFVNQGGVFTTFEVPGATFTRALGINDRGQIVGEYSDPILHRGRGF